MTARPHISPKIKGEKLRNYIFIYTPPCFSEAVTLGGLIPFNKAVQKQLANSSLNRSAAHLKGLSIQPVN